LEGRGVGDTHITGSHIGGDTHITSDICTGIHISRDTHITHITVTPGPKCFLCFLVFKKRTPKANVFGRLKFVFMTVLSFLICFFSLL